MSVRDNEEFRNAIREIAAQGPVRLDSPYDRVRLSEWARKLAGMPNDNFDTAKTRNEYAQLLRIMVRRGILHGIFLRPPPDNDLAPLPECLGNEMSNLIPHLPRSGPISPVVMHRSRDGRAYIAAKRIPDGGVFCYMAVTPDKM